MKISARVFMCLLLIACFTVSISPVRADALSADDVEMVTVPGKLVVGASLIALGIMPGESDTDFDTVVDYVLSGSEFNAYITDSMMSVVKYTRAGDGAVSYAVPLAFLDALRSWAFDSGILTYSFSPGFGARIEANTNVQIRNDGTSIA